MDKLKSFFKKESKATGHRLGSAGDGQSSQLAGAQPASGRPAASNTKGASANASRSPWESAGQPRVLGYQGPTQPPPRDRLSATSHLTDASAAQPSHGAPVTSEDAQARGWKQGATTSQPGVPVTSSSERPAHLSSSQQAPGAEPSEEVENAVAVFLSMAEPESAAPQTLARILHNICSQPDNPKFRILKMSNTKIRASVLEAHGALDLLEACGFQMQLADGSSAADGTLSLPMRCNLSDCRAAHHLLQITMPEAPDAAFQSSGAVTASLSSPPATSAAPAPEEHVQRASSASQSTQHTSPKAAASAVHDHVDPGPSVTTGALMVSNPDAAHSSIASQAVPQPSRPPDQVSQDSGPPAQQTSPPASSSLQAEEHPAERTAKQNDDRSSGNLAMQPLEVKRNTQVLLPVEPNAQVPEWIFERTGLELKRMWQAARKQREQDQVLMTRATRQRLAQQRLGPSPASAPSDSSAIRVRFPNGLLLQGTFAAAEPVAMVEAWVADALADPLTPFNLILPTRQPLQAGRGQTVKQADLLPAVTLSFQQVGEALTGPGGWGMHGSTQQALIRDELLQAARPAA